MRRLGLGGTGCRVAAVVLVLLALVASGCAGDADDEGTGREGAQAETATDGGSTTPGGEPIVVGSTLSLTGAFAATGAIHKVAGEQFVERLNANGGLLGRPVEWRVLDDESDPAKVSALYERLIGQERVDLIMGPYATPNIVAAMAVAERHGYVLPNHTAVLTYALTYECQFPTWSTGFEPNLEVPELVFDALESTGQPPKRVAFVTNAGGSTNFVSAGPPDSTDGGAVEVARRRGLEVVLDVKYPPETSNWGPLAARIRGARPDLVWNSGLGLDPVNLLQAMQQLNYKPPYMFTLFPAPGPLLGMGAAADGVLAISLFEPNGPVLDRLGSEAEAIVGDFATAAEREQLPYTVFESQAAASWTAWEVLAAGVEGAGDVDNRAICDWLLDNEVETTFVGTLEFDPDRNNFPPAHSVVKQIQDGDWVVVWPEDMKAAELREPE